MKKMNNNYNTYPDFESLYALALGGVPPSKYEAEGGEVVDGGIPTAFSGGNISPNSSQAAMINGDSHEQGGVEMSGGARVFSDRLKVSKEFAPKSKKTYAQVANTLTKKVGELEDKLKSSDRFAKETAKRMLPMYQTKLDKLFEEQEATKQATFQKDYNQLQMKYGGDLTKYGLGGDIAGGLVGIAGGALGSIPVVGDMAQKGLYTLNEKLDPNMTDQSKSIRGFGAAAGGIGTAALTGNPKAAMGAIGDIQEGIEYGTTENPMGYAYGGRLPKMGLGGEPILPGETWLQYSQRVPNADLNFFNQSLADPNNNIQYQQSQSDLRGKQSPIQSALQKDFAANGVAQSDNSYLKQGAIYTPQTPYTEPNFNGNESQNKSGNTEGSQGNTSGSNGPLSDLLYKGAAYAPTIYNTIKGLQKPQVLNHEEFQNPYESQAMGLMANRRYDIDPQLQSNRSTLNNMKTNLRNYAGGNAGTYLSNMGNLQMNTDRMNEQAYSTKNNMDNQYKAQEAQFMGGMGANRAQTKFNIQDVNDRNKAARDAHMGKAVEGLSGIAQNNRRMSNLDSRDQERIMALNYMFPDYAYNSTGSKVTGLNYKD